MCQRPCGDKAIDIKALVVYLSCHYLIQKCLSFPNMIYVNIVHLLLDSLITNIDFLFILLLPSLVLFPMFLCRYSRLHKDQQNKDETFKSMVRELFIQVDQLSRERMCCCVFSFLDVYHAG